MDDAWPYVVVAVGALVTYVWRGLGVALAGRLSPDGRVIDWVTCVAYALLAGLIARMIILPIGPLAETELWARLVAAGAGVAAYGLFGRSVLLGVVAGCVALIGLILVSS